MKKLASRLFPGLQFLLPRYAMTAAVYRLTRVRQRGVKDLLIRNFVKAFRVDIDEVAAEVPQDFATFNDFFTRRLLPSARPIDPASDALVSPVDGTVSAAGKISQGLLLQAKGLQYQLDDLLATDIAEAGNYSEGHYFTIYLAPHNYHRVHAPLCGRLVALRYVPGDLFSVNRATVTRLRDLFARNERLVCHFETDSGPVALLFVGALNVGSISTPWTGEIRPRRRGVVEEIDLNRSTADRNVRKGDLLGWFNMGSTVIVLLPPGSCEFRKDLVAGQNVVMGESLATIRRPWT